MNHPIKPIIMKRSLLVKEVIRTYAGLILCMVLIGFGQDAYAQDNSISGVVRDAQGLTVPGVTVVVKGTTTGTSTDMDGAYTIKAPEDAILQFSSIGFITQEIPVDGQSTVDVSLETNSEVLDELIVTGYGTQKKSHVTGAISKVEGSKIAAIQADRVDDALAGKLSGVLIQNQDGEPGADPKIQVRAASSISGNSNPLVVVDGYPITGSLATINPNDIESLEVLKDAASAAIYGSRGANGVILVTTKKGSAGGSGKPSVSYNGYVSISNKYVKNLDARPSSAEWADELDRGIASGEYDVSEIEPAIVDYKIDAYRNSPDVENVQDWLFRTGYSTSHDVAVGGATENVNYRASIGYLNTEGIALDQEFERYNARLNVDAKLSEKFKAGVNINGAFGNRNLVGTDMRDLLRAHSIHPIYHTEESIAFVQQLDQQAQELGLDAFDLGYRGGDSPFNSSIYTLEPGMTAQDWHYGRSGNGIGGSGDAGPATKLDNTDRYQKTFFANISSYLQYNIIEGLDLKTVLGGDINNSEDYFWQGLEFDSRGRTNQTSLDQTNLSRSSVLSETTLNYFKVFREVHEVTAVAGFEFQNFYTNGISLNGTNVPFGYPPNFGILNPADIAVAERDETIARNSIFGRVNYAYDNRYLVSVSVRRDGDSRFGENNQYEAFPAISLGWNVHNEAFYNLDVLSALKLRFSRGTLGTTSFLGAYNSLSLLDPQATIFGNGFGIPSDLANPDLTWQTNTETNYGFNAGFLENRITLGFDYYTSDIEDILINQSVSEVYGTTTVALNSGDVRSSGLELDFGVVLMDKKDLVWRMNGNFSTVNTEITDLGGLDELPQVIYGQSGRGPVFRNYVGGQIGEMWGIETTGEVETQYMADPLEYTGKETGYSYAVDQNGDGVIDRTRTVEEGGDLVKIGQNTPDFYWGVSSQVFYKEFDLSIQLQGAQGGEVYNIDPLYYGSQFGRALQPEFDVNEDGIADHNGQLYVRNQDQTDAMIQDASYMAIRNLTIGYTFKPEWTKKAGIGSIRAYVASSNLLYIFSNDYTSFNPEGVEVTNSGYLGPTTYGVQVGASPTVRSFTLGVNVNFN